MSEMKGNRLYLDVLEAFKRKVVFSVIVREAGSLNLFSGQSDVIISESSELAFDLESNKERILNLASPLLNNAPIHVVRGWAFGSVLLTCRSKPAK